MITQQPAVLYVRENNASANLLAQIVNKFVLIDNNDIKNKLYSIKKIKKKDSNFNLAPFLIVNGKIINNIDLIYKYIFEERKIQVPQRRASIKNYTDDYDEYCKTLSDSEDEKDMDENILKTYSGNRFNESRFNLGDKLNNTKHKRGENKIEPINDSDDESENEKIKIDKKVKKYKKSEDHYDDYNEYLSSNDYFKGMKDDD